MKKIKICFPFIVFVFLCFSVKAQESTDLISNFTSKVDKEYYSILKASQKSIIRKAISNRKYFVEGRSDSLKCSFKQKIRFYKNGLRKEVVKLYRTSNSGNDLLVCQMVKLNDVVKYVVYYEYIHVTGKGTRTVRKETLVDGKIYQRKDYVTLTVAVNKLTIVSPSENHY